MEMNSGAARVSQDTSVARVTRAVRSERESAIDARSASELRALSRGHSEHTTSVRLRPMCRGNVRHELLAEFVDEAELPRSVGAIRSSSVRGASEAERLFREFRVSTASER